MGAGYEQLGRETIVVIPVVFYLKVGEKLGKLEVEKRRAIEMEDYDLAKAKKVRGFVSIFFSCPLLFYFKAKLEACKHDMLRGFKRILCW